MHKEEFLGVPNSIGDRGRPDGPEIYLMEGMPQQMKDDFFNEKFMERDRLILQNRLLNKGQSQMDEAERENKKPKYDETESKETRAARRREHMAKKLAEKKAMEAAANGGSVGNQANGGQATGAQAVSQGPGDGFAAQESYLQFEQNDAPAHFGSTHAVSSPPPSTYFDLTDTFRATTRMATTVATLLRRRWVV